MCWLEHRTVTARKTLHYTPLSLWKSQTQVLLRHIGSIIDRNSSKLLSEPLSALWCNIPQWEQRQVQSTERKVRATVLLIMHWYIIRKIAFWVQFHQFTSNVVIMPSSRTEKHVINKKIICWFSLLVSSSSASGVSTVIALPCGRWSSDAACCVSAWWRAALQTKGRSSHGHYLSLPARRPKPTATAPLLEVSRAAWLWLMYKMVAC